MDMYTYMYTHIQVKQKCQETMLVGTVQAALRTFSSLLSLKNDSSSCDPLHLFHERTNELLPTV